MPQLSFLFTAIKPLLGIDFTSVLPTEINLRIFSYLDAESLCRAAQVCKLWKDLAENDIIWHKLYEQNFGKKCVNCGWGLPLLKKRLTSLGTNQTTLMTSSSSSAFPPSSPTDNVTLKVQLDRAAHNTRGVPVPDQGAMVSMHHGDEQLAKCTNIVQPAVGERAVLSSSPKRPWKEIYAESLTIESNWRKNKYTSRVLSGHTDGIMCLQFDDSRNILITGSFDKTVRVWNLETGETLRVLSGHTQCVRALQFDDVKLVTGSMDSTLKIWNYHTGECIRTLEGHTEGVICLHFDFNNILASGSTDTTIKIWNFSSGETYALRGHTSWVNSVRFCNETILVSGSDDTTIRLWDLGSRSCIRILNGHASEVQSVGPSMLGFSPDILDYHTVPSEIEQQKQGPDDPDGSGGSDVLFSYTPIIISGSLDNTIRIWCAQSGRCLRTLFGHAEAVWTLAYNKFRIVSGSHDRTIKVWDMDSGKCVHTLEGHMGLVTAVALGNTKIVSGSDEGELRVWDYGGMTRKV